MRHRIVVQDGIAGDGFTTHPSNQGSAQHHDDGETLHELDHEGAAKDDQRNADGQAQHQQHHVALRRSRHGDHVVEAHHQVGNEDGANGGHQAAIGLGLALFLLVVAEQLKTNPQQQADAHDLQERKLQQLGRHHRQQDPQNHGGAGAPEHGFLLLMGGKGPGGQRDDHRVIARKNDVDPDDLHQADPEIGALQKLHD